MSKSLWNRRKTYILDVIWSGPGRSSRPVQWAWYLSSQNRRSLCLSVFCSRKKQTGWLRNCLCKYSWEVSRFILEILENSKVIASILHLLSIKVYYKNPLKIPRSKKRTPELCGFFVDHHCKFHPFSNSLQEIPHAITFTRN